MRSLGLADVGRNPSAGHIGKAQRAHQFGEGVNFLRRAGDLKHKALERAIDYVNAKNIRQTQRLDPVFAFADNFEHRQFTFHAWAFDGEVMHLMDWHDPTDLRLDLLDYLRGAAGDDGDARQMTGVIDLCHGQAVDVIAPA